MNSEIFTFRRAVPVWEENMEGERNFSLIFRYIAEDDTELKLKVSADRKYQIFVDGMFFSSGASRKNDGFFTADEYLIKDELSPKGSIISIIAASPDEGGEAFFCCEIIRDGQVVFATEEGISAVRNISRVQKTERFAPLKHFTESYIYDAYYDGFMTDKYASFRSIRLKNTENRNFIKNNSAISPPEGIRAEKITGRGIAVPSKNPEKYNEPASYNGFSPDEISDSPVNEVMSYDYQVLESDEIKMESTKLGINCFSIYDMGKEVKGNIRLSLTAENDTVLYAVFGKKLSPALPCPVENSCVNVLRFAIQGGRPYDFTSFEEYDFRYIQIISMYAPSLITNVSVFTEEKTENNMN